MIMMFSRFCGFKVTIGHFFLPLFICLLISGIGTYVYLYLSKSALGGKEMKELRVATRKMSHTPTMRKLSTFMPAMRKYSFIPVESKVHIVMQHQWRSQRGAGWPRRLELRPKHRGGFAARMLQGAPPPAPRCGSAPNGGWAGRARIASPNGPRVSSEAEDHSPPSQTGFRQIEAPKPNRWLD